MAEKKAAPKKVQRIYKNDGVIDSDTFKLETAQFMKNISFTKEKQLVPVEHCHFFHTFDSSGRRMEFSNKVGGHHHKVEVSEEDGKLVAVCGPAIGGHDNHIHAVDYIKSDKVEIRKINKDAQQYLASMK